MCTKSSQNSFFICCLNYFRAHLCKCGSVFTIFSKVQSLHNEVLYLSIIFLMFAPCSHGIRRVLALPYLFFPTLIFLIYFIMFYLLDDCILNADFLWANFHFSSFMQLNMLVIFWVCVCCSVLFGKESCFRFLL